MQTLKTNNPAYQKLRFGWDLRLSSPWARLKKDLTHGELELYLRDRDASRPRRKVALSCYVNSVGAVYSDKLRARLLEFERVDGKYVLSSDTRVTIVELFERDETRVWDLNNAIPKVEADCSKLLRRSNGSAVSSVSGITIIPPEARYIPELTTIELVSFNALPKEMAQVADDS